jgi:hypothetical protein
MVRCARYRNAERAATRRARLPLLLASVAVLLGDRRNRGLAVAYRSGDRPIRGGLRAEGQHLLRRDLLGPLGAVGELTSGIGEGLLMAGLSVAICRNGVATIEARVALVVRRTRHGRRPRHAGGAAPGRSSSRLPKATVRKRATDRPIASAARRAARRRPRYDQLRRAPFGKSPSATVSCCKAPRSSCHLRAHSSRLPHCRIPPGRDSRTREHSRTSEAGGHNRFEASGSPGSQGGTTRRRRRPRRPDTRSPAGSGSCPNKVHRSCTMEAESLVGASAACERSMDASLESDVDVVDPQAIANSGIMANRPRSRRNMVITSLRARDA